MGYELYSSYVMYLHCLVPSLDSLSLLFSNLYGENTTLYQHTNIEREGDLEFVALNSGQQCHLYLSMWTI